MNKLINKIHSLSIHKKILDIAVIVFSIALFQTSIKWILGVFFGLYDLFNLFLFLIIVVLIGNKLKWKLDLKFNTLNFQFRVLPFLIVLFAILLNLFSSRIININIVSATAGFIYLFGLVGLYTHTRFWIKSIIPFSLILMTLPFGNIMDVYIGFPLRLIAVDSIASIFNSLGLQSVTSSTIITIENSATQIDFSCSGLKGIWSALLFYFSITWLDNLKLGLNWLVTFMLLIITIIAANIFRIFIIVSLCSIYNHTQLADIIHAPLGIIGFVFSCALIYYLTKTNIYKKEILNISLSSILINKLDSIKPRVYTKLNWTRIVLLVFIICASAFSTKRINGINQNININYLANWETAPIKLTKEETTFFKKEGSSTSKISFKVNQLSGSLLLVKSNGWRGHHNPEYCIRAGGNKINKLETIKIATDFPIKWMNVNDNASACYWFQSPSECTDDFGTRVWSEIKNQETNWTMVSVVFNNHQNLEKLIIKDFLIDLNKLIKKHNTNSYEQN